MVKGIQSGSSKKGKSPRKAKAPDGIKSQSLIHMFQRQESSSKRRNESNPKEGRDTLENKDVVNDKVVKTNGLEDGVQNVNESKYFMTSLDSNSNKPKSIRKMSKLSLSGRKSIINKTEQVELSTDYGCSSSNNFENVSDLCEPFSPVSKRKYNSMCDSESSNLLLEKKGRLETENIICSATIKTLPISDNVCGNTSLFAKGSTVEELSVPKTELKTASNTPVDQSKQECSNILTKIEMGISHTSNITESADLDEQEKNEYKVPYYLENFICILDSVIKDEFYAYLFNDDDLVTITTFQEMSENAKKLYVRLFGRQFRWIRKSKVTYPKIAEDLSDVLEELFHRGLLMNESSLFDLNEVLVALPVTDLKTVAKSLRININQPREQLISAVIKHTTQSNIGNFFKVKSSASDTSGIHNSVLIRAKKLLGQCYKICKDGRSVFMRMMLLFGLHHMQGEDDDRGGGQGQLFQMLMSNIGKVKYPEYEVHRKTKIFQNRDGLKRFSSALQAEVEMSEALEKKEFEVASEVYTCAKEMMNELMMDQDIVQHDESLPQFLRIYTAGAVYTRVLSKGVELYQFIKKYDLAVKQLHSLIQQDLYHTDYRGRWFERLVLNLDHHLKKPSEALNFVKKGLSDENIRVGHRYALFQRAQKICNANANKKLRKRWAEFSEDVMVCVQDPPKVYIKGRQVKNVAPGGFAMFISEESLIEGNEEVTFLKRVEDVALKHYKEAGYSEGLHAEGTIFSFFLTIYMWDIKFCTEEPDVFYNLYQTMPLDLYTMHFYERRKMSINKRLQLIKNASDEELHVMLEEKWNAHKDTLCVGINWELFRDLDHVKGLVSCIGGSLLSAILERMVKDMRFTRSGVPDLTVWNTDTKKFKIIEVKGPGDRLSTKQILWLDYLISHGIDAEVCHVQAVGAKKIH